MLEIGPEVLKTGLAISEDFGRLASHVQVVDPLGLDEVAHSRFVQKTDEELFQGHINTLGNRMTTST